MTLYTPTGLKRIACVAALVGLSACAQVDEFPMLNLATNQTVVCHSGTYWLEEEDPQMRILAQCLRACGRAGYRSVNDLISDPHTCDAAVSSQIYKDKQHSQDACNAEPDEDVRGEIPPDCLR